MSIARTLRRRRVPPRLPWRLLVRLRPVLPLGLPVPGLAGLPVRVPRVPSRQRRMSIARTLPRVPPRRPGRRLGRRRPALPLGLPVQAHAGRPVRVPRVPSRQVRMRVRVRVSIARTLRSRRVPPRLPWRLLGRHRPVLPLGLPDPGLAGLPALDPRVPSRQVNARDPTQSSGVVAGTATPTTAAPRSASGACLVTGTRASGSVLPGLRARIPFAGAPSGRSHREGVVGACC